MVTDFDCWHPVEAHVTANMALANLSKNAARASQVVAHAIKLLATGARASSAHTALQNALVTQPKDMGADVRARLDVILR